MDKAALSSMSGIFIVYALNQDRRRKVFYEINGDYYETITLQKETGAFRRIYLRKRFDLSRLNSYGFFLMTEQRDWLVAILSSNNVIILDWSGPEAITRSFGSVYPLSVPDCRVAATGQASPGPDLSNYIQGQYELSRHIIPGVNFSRFEEISQISVNNATGEGASRSLESISDLVFTFSLDLIRSSPCLE